MRGKSYWKFNNDLLMDKIYVEKINKSIHDIKHNVYMADKNQLWEYIKCQLRTDNILYASQKAKINKKVISELKDKLEVM